MADLADRMTRQAKTGFYDGQNYESVYFQRAKRLHPETGTLLIFMRDVGMHSSGWFKNPDYERCWHLSVSFWDVEANAMRPYEAQLAETWVRCFYRGNAHYVWEEGNFRIDVPGVRHYRVLCDRMWQPIIPRGEVYSLDFTEKGWKSWSDQRYEAGLEQQEPDRWGPA